jgi:hypothetical protein
MGAMDSWFLFSRSNVRPLHFAALVKVDFLLQYSFILQRKFRQQLVILGSFQVGATQNAKGFAFHVRGLPGTGELRRMETEFDWIRNSSGGVGGDDSPAMVEND